MEEEKQEIDSEIIQVMERPGSNARWTCECQVRIAISSEKMSGGAKRLGLVERATWHLFVLEKAPLVTNLHGNRADCDTCSAKERGPWRKWDWNCQGSKGLAMRRLTTYPNRTFLLSSRPSSSALYFFSDNHLAYFLTLR